MRIIKLMFLVVILVQGHACTFDEHKTTNPKASKTIAQSKENGVFVQSMSYERPLLHAIGNKGLTFCDIWIERIWKYKSTKGEIEILEDYQLVISTKQTDLTNFMETWSLCLDDDCQVGLRNGNIVFDQLLLSKSYSLSSIKLETAYSFKDYKKTDKITVWATNYTD